MMKSLLSHSRVADYVSGPSIQFVAAPRDIPARRADPRWLHEHVELENEHIQTFGRSVPVSLLFAGGKRHAV